MKMVSNSQSRRRERGNVLMSALAVMALGLIISAAMLQWATSTLSTRKVVESNADNFYAVERSINAVTAWLQSNSKNLVNAFQSTNFTNSFDLGNPVAGGNEGTAFAVPTMVKIRGTNNAVQLTNSTYFGTSAFPTTTNIDSGASFDPVASFGAADFGAGVNVRLLMVWALLTNGSYQPIFRIDAVTGGTGPEHGVHGINFISSAFVSSTAGVGYYADTGDLQTQTPNNQCWSYQFSYNSSTNTWSRGAARSNCLITGADDISLRSAIHGAVLTNKVHGIDLQNGASISGTRCEGSGCVTYTLPNNPSWQTRCGGVPAVDVTISSAVQNITSGSTLASQCFRDITIPSNKTANFNSTDYPYYIRSILPQNNSNSKITFTTKAPGNKYTLYVDNLANGQINGNQMVGTNLAPSQLEINITQDGTLTLNGTANFHGVIIGTHNHTIVHSGNFTFYGALRSNALSFSGNAVLGYDEGLGGTPAISDINFTLYKASQRYR